MRMVVRRQVQYPSSQAETSRSSQSRKASKEDGDHLQNLTNVQRQLVQKSFQTHAFELKIKSKDAEEQAATATEVLEQALRSHAASVASLNVDGLPFSDEHRHRLPHKSLGRVQYEDLGRMPTLMTEAHSQATERPFADGPSTSHPSSLPQPQSQSHPQPRSQAPQAGPVAGTGDGSEGDGTGARSTGGGDGAVGSDSGGGGGAAAASDEDAPDMIRSGAEDGAASEAALASALLSPSPSPSPTRPTGQSPSGQRRVGGGGGVHPWSSSTGGGAAVLTASSSPRFPTNRSLPRGAPTGSGARSSSSGDGGGGGSSGDPGRSAPGDPYLSLTIGAELGVASGETEFVVGGGSSGGGGAESGLRRADQLLQTLRGLNGPVGAAGGAGGPAAAALPYITRPQSHMLQSPSHSTSPACLSAKPPAPIFNLGALGGTAGKTQRRQPAGSHAAGSHAGGSYPGGSHAGSSGFGPPSAGGSSVEHGPYAPYTSLQTGMGWAVQECPGGGRSGSVTGGPRPQPYPHPPPRSRSPQHPRPGTRQSWNPRSSGGSQAVAAAAAVPAAELSATALLPPPTRGSGTLEHVGGGAGGGGAGGGEWLAGRTGGNRSFTSPWRPVPPAPPPPPQVELSGASGSAGGSGGGGVLSRRASMRATGSLSGEALPPPPPPGPGPLSRGIRRSSATDDGGGGGEGSSPRYKGLLPGTGPHAPPPASVSEQLFTRISRSAAREGVAQQWVPVFEGPLPPSVASGFAAASIGASPYAAGGLSASVDMGDSPWDAAATAAAVGFLRRSSPPLSQQRPPSGAPHQQGKAAPDGGPAPAVRLPPIADAASASLPASGTSTGAGDGPVLDLPRSLSSRKGHLRASLSWSAPAVEAAPTAAAAITTTTITPSAGPPPSQRIPPALRPDTEPPPPGNGPAAAAASAAAARGPTLAAGRVVAAAAASRGRSVSTDGELRRPHPAGGGGGGGGGRSDLRVVGGCAPTTPRPRQRRKERTPAGRVGGGFDGAWGAGFRSNRAGAGKAVSDGAPAEGQGGGSPSIMSRMLQALDSFLGRSPPPRRGGGGGGGDHAGGEGGGLGYPAVVAAGTVYDRSGAAAVCQGVGCEG